MMDDVLGTLEFFSPLLALGFGFIVGIQHAFEADHVAAVSTQISKLKLEKQSTFKSIKNGINKSSVLGIAWGTGHTTTIILIGFLVYVLAISINDIIFSGFDIVVGIMLVFLGVISIFKIKFKQNIFLNNNQKITSKENPNNKNQKYLYRSYVIGLFHGLAGSGSLIILTSLTIEIPSLMMVFFLIFGVGSILGMILVSSMIGIPLSLKNEGINKKTIRIIAGIFSLGIGISIIYQNWIFF